MFCKNCGSQVNDGAEFCPNCGAKTAQAAAPVNPAAPANPAPPVNPAPQFNNSGMNMTPPAQPAGQKADTKVMVKKYAPIGIGAVALIVIIAIIIGAVAGGYKKPLKNYYKALEKQDTEMYRKCMPELYEMLQEDKDDINMQYDQELESERKNFGMESKSKISYKIMDSTKYEKKELEELNEGLKKVLELKAPESTDYSKYKITAAYKITVRETVKTDGETKDYRHKYILIKENGSWKLITERYLGEFID